MSDVLPVGRIGRYEVLGRLASGGMAEVFVARATGPREVARRVVVKRLLPHVVSDAAKVEAFVQEARLTSRLSHPNLCAVHDFGDEGGAFHLVLEWVRGPSLRRVIARAKETRSAVPIAITARIVASLASALHHAHVATDDAGRLLGIVHRDVTPENVIVGWNGVPKLIDFGIAKSVIDPRKTEVGVLKGKLAFISPEQYRGETLDGRSDVFALALCAFELLTGESLYERDSEFETVAAIVVDPSVPSVRERRADVPIELEQIVQRGLAKDRAARYASADEMARALDAWLATRGEPIGEREIAAWLGALFPGESSKEPALDRTPLDARPTPARMRTRSEEMHALQLTADAELDAEEMAKTERARRARIVVAMLLAALAALGVIAWAVARPRAAAPVVLESGG
ncbi:serine/threonine-protein kinase [Sandaracinus amylolyticus]|uniref:Serine/threonine protein kinase n=1 Tax=Sandaracinus amylolyticus TaxID=927083 RepID=A0A0F6W3J3_9BACT|nr:serine/threonine-protein kinase [Sandaracinus amylolyticus]AKF06390.1 serine/threonine protein kinase [Sandaracinus amylolyticus]